MNHKCCVLTHEFLKMKLNQPRFPALIFLFSLVVLGPVHILPAYAKLDSARVYDLIRQGKELTGKDEVGSIGLLKNALNLADSLGMENDQIVSVILSIADYDTYHGKLDSAIMLSLKALRYFETRGRKGETVQVLNRIGDILRANGMYENGYTFFRQALAVLKDHPDSTLLASVYNRMAACFYEDTGISLDSAERYARRSLDISRKLNIQKRIFNNLNILGSIESKRGNYRTALEYYYQALPILLVVAPKEEPLILANMSRNFAMLSEFGKAEELSRRALALSERHGIPQYELMACMNLTFIYRSQGDYRRALEFQERFSRIENELLTQRVLVQVQDFNHRSEIEKQINEKKQLALEQKVTENRLRVTYLLAALLFIILLSAVAFVLYQNRQRKKLNLLMKKLDQSNQVLKRFISIVAHDLRSPFNSILGFSELLIKETDLSDEERRVAIGHLHSSSRSTFNLLERLLEWSRLQSGSIHPQKKVINLNGLVRETLVHLEASAGIKKISLSFSEDRQIMVFADPDMILTAIRNLVSNAIKFTNPGGGVSVVLTQDEERIILNVIDNGVGMEDNVVERLFRIEENYKSKGTAGEQGTGLGLILCRDYVEMNGGKLLVSSEPGKGSTFTIELPYAEQNH